jgi:Holliday junction resolvase RusA-like endonuclease
VGPFGQRAVVLRVAGIPASQGSKTGIVTESGKVIIREGRNREAYERHQSWRAEVARAGRDWRAAAGMPEPLDGPVEVSIVFYLEKPASRPKGVVFADRKPDIDKLVRSVLDSLTDAGVLREDSRVVDLHALKLYARRGASPGVVIVVRPAEPRGLWWRVVARLVQQTRAVA